MSLGPGLNDAAAVLEAQAAGVPPERQQVLVGALALSTLCLRGTADRDLLDAAAGLEALATGQSFDLTAEGRARAGTLAARVRREIPTPGATTLGT